MTQLIIAMLLLALGLTSCGPAAVPTTQPPAVTSSPASPSSPSQPSPSASPVATRAAAPAATKPAPSSTPTSFPPGIDPLTGLSVPPANLDRRPILIKVENLPRYNRPQFGLSLADLVYEYYTEEGTTRFAALYYGQDAKQVAPIRSARYFDMNLIRMYQAVFIFGGAYYRLRDDLYQSDFYDRLIVEGVGTCPALCRYDPNGSDLLMANTARVAGLLQKWGRDNHRQDLAGMTFGEQPPAGGTPVTRVTTRFSGAIYNRWDYDQASGRYLRHSDAQDDTNDQNEVYSKLFDRLTGKQISADNLVVILAAYFKADPESSGEVLDVRLSGTGPAYLFRDGQLFIVKWQRKSDGDLLTLARDDGSPVAFKPGNTWFEVMGQTSRIEQNDGSIRFTHKFP